jgi:hypothetical protein
MYNITVYKYQKNSNGDTIVVVHHKEVVLSNPESIRDLHKSLLGRMYVGSILKKKVG